MNLKRPNCPWNRSLITDSTIWLCTRHQILHTWHCIGGTVYSGHNHHSTTPSFKALLQQLGISSEAQVCSKHFNIITNFSYTTRHNTDQIQVFSNIFNLYNYLQHQHRFKLLPTLTTSSNIHFALLAIFFHVMLIWKQAHHFNLSDTPPSIYSSRTSVTWLQLSCNQLPHQNLTHNSTSKHPHCHVCSSQFHFNQSNSPYDTAIPPIL